MYGLVVYGLVMYGMPTAIGTIGNFEELLSIIYYFKIAIPLLKTKIIKKPLSDSKSTLKNTLEKIFIFLGGFFFLL